MIMIGVSIMIMATVPGVTVSIGPEKSWKVSPETLALRCARALDCSYKLQTREAKMNTNTNSREIREFLAMASAPSFAFWQDSYAYRGADGLAVGHVEVQTETIDETIAKIQAWKANH